MFLEIIGNLLCDWFRTEDLNELKYINGCGLTTLPKRFYKSFT